MSEVRISAEPRSEFGKGAARRVRRSNKVPAVLYGHGTPPKHISLPGHELMLALKTPNVLLRLGGLEGGEELALPKAVQRDVVTGFLEHVDLLLVRRGEKVIVDVPVHVVGDLASDGFLDQQLVSISVAAEATHIPQEIEVSIEGASIGQSIHAGQIALPAGCELHTDAEAIVIHIGAAPTVPAGGEEAPEAAGASAAPAAEAEQPVSAE